MGGFENVVEVTTSQPPMVMTLLPSRVHCKQTPKRLGDGAHLHGPRSRRRVHGRLATLPCRPAGARLLPPQPRPPLAPSPDVGRSLQASDSPLLLAGCSAGMAGQPPGTRSLPPSASNAAR